MRSEIDAHLVRKAQRGDPEARGQVVEACRTLFQRALGRRGTSGEAQEDIIQEALLVVLRQLEGFAWRAKFETWALAILFRTQQRYREVETMRGQRYALESDIGSDDDPEAFERSAGSGPRGDDPAQQTLQQALREALGDCLKPVPVEMREVWVRHRFHGQQHNEIADALKLSINTVGTRIFRADRKLRDCLEKKGFTADTVAGGR
jgi:RNA polymerase sigma factor (sigma-70 family)